MRSKLSGSFLIFLLLVLLSEPEFLGVCCQRSPRSGRGYLEMPMRPVEEVKEAHCDELMSIRGVVGVFVGSLDDGSPCIKLMVIKRTAELERSIPPILEGYPVLIEETGEILPM